MTPRHATLHLCNNPRHLLFALTDALASEAPARLLYLEDDLPLPESIRAALREVCPAVDISYTTDRAEMTRFAALPGWFPEVVRRNLRLSGSGRPLRPQSWRGSALGGERFATGYVYHSGFFMSKVAAGLCERVILRESGLNNYTTLQVPALKALLRLLSGLSPRQQIWGEERWVDAIEVEHPDRLPPSVRPKARALSFSRLQSQVPPARARRLAESFCTAVPDIRGTRPSALILTQPLDTQSFFGREEKIRLYQEIADQLIAAGYRTFTKNHPREDEYTLSGADMLPKFFPIEAWPLVSEERFDLAVALCSASLSQQAGELAEVCVQLIPVELFDRRSRHRWQFEIRRALTQATTR